MGKPTAIRLVTVAAEQEGQRVDNFLVRHLKGVPKSHVYRLLRTGQVRVNKGRIRADYRLKSGDLVRIPPLRQAESPQPQPSQAAFQRLEGAVLYEDDALLALNKPAGMAVHGGSGLSYGVIEALRAMHPKWKFLELVHRLDRDTSGCLLVAKKRSALVDLHEQLRLGKVDKRYFALVAGPWSGANRTVSAPLRKNVLSSGERIVRVNEQDGKQAVTRFSPVSRFGELATLVEARLDTGRTHQIRVHAAHVGHPLAGDEKYGDPAFNTSMRELGLRRLFLHAHFLEFRKPGSQAELQISAPLSADLRDVLNRLESR